MRIILSDRKIEKPMEKPIMIKKTSKINLNKSKFSIIKPKNITFNIKPTASTKNDQVNLFIQSFSDQHRELFQQFEKIKVDNNGIYLPEQDKVFFETVVTTSKLEYFITSNEELSEYTNQQISFTWRKAPVFKTETCIYDGINKNNGMGYEMQLKYPSCLSLSIDQRLKEKPLREYLDRSRTLLKDEKVIIQFGFQPAENYWYKEGDLAFKNLPKRIRDKSKSSQFKLGEQGFDCCIRLIVNSPNESRLDVIARGFIFAMKQLNGDNELIDKKVKEKSFDRWLNEKVIKRKINSPLLFKNRIVLTQKEIAHFIKLPESNLQREFEIETDNRDEITVPKSLLGKSGILIGHTDIKGVMHPITLPTENLDDVAKPYIFCGSPRQGKDVGQINFIVEVSKKGYGAFIPDVIDERGNTRGMSDSIRDAIPKDKIIDLNFGDYLNPIYFGLEDIIEKLGNNGLNIVANNLIKILKLDEHATTQRACRVIAKACKCNLYTMSMFVRSDKFAHEILEKIKDEDELLALQLKHEYLENSKMNIAKDALYTKLDEILGNDHFRNMMSQEPNNKIDFEKWIKEGKIVIARMRKIDIGDIGVQILIYLFTLKLFWMKKIMETDDMTFVVFNEPHQFMSDPLEELLSSMLVESPKYRLGILMAFHDKSFISKNLYSSIKSSALNWFMYKTTNKEMYESMKEELHPISIEMAIKTEKHESIFLPFIQGKPEQPFFLEMLPPPYLRMNMYDNSSLTKQGSIEYGKPLDEVMKMLIQKETSLYQQKVKSDDKKKK